MGDFRYAIRSLANAPGFSSAAILILTLGIAGNTAVFSAVDVLLLEPLPFRDAARLVVVTARHRTTSARAGVTPDELQQWSAHAITLEQVEAVRLEQAFDISSEAEPVRVTGGRMTGGLLPLLGVVPVRGRGFLPSDEKPGAPPAVLITDRFWERRFNRGEGVVGTAMIVDGAPATIVGILPHDFRLLYGGYSVWAPLPRTAVADAGDRSTLVIGRLVRGTTVSQAIAELAARAEAADRARPEHERGWQPRVVSMREFFVGGRQHTLLFLAGALFILLLAVCANTASLQLARAVARGGEIATRFAIGASRWRIVRQLLVEAATIASVSAVLGIALVAATRQALLAGSPDLRELAISPRVLAFTLAVAAAASVAVGLVPALTGTRMELASVLNGAATPRRTTRRLLSSLVVVEIASSLVLLVPAGLLFKSFVALRQLDAGFEPEGVLTFSVALPRTRYPDASKQAAFHAEALQRLAGLPGVRAAAAASALPLEAVPIAEIQIESGEDGAGRARAVRALIRWVSTGYIRTLGIPLLHGREFEPSDDGRGPRVAMVNETLARAMSGTGRAIGATIRTKAAGTATIVGVVADLRSVGLRTPPQPEVLLPLPQHPVPNVSFAVTTLNDPALSLPAVRDAMRSLDRDLPLGSLRPLSDLLAEQVAAVRAIAVLLGALALLTLVLATAGLLGLTSRFVALRAREFGIRAALGATRGDIVRLVLRDAGYLVCWGLALGLPAAAILARAVSSQLWGVSAGDPITFASLSAVLALATCSACYVPAARAARRDPASALRAV